MFNNVILSYEQVRFFVMNLLMFEFSTQHSCSYFSEFISEFILSVVAIIFINSETSVMISSI